MIGNRERQRRFGHEVDCVAEIRCNARRGFTALLGLNAGYRDAPYASAEQQCSESGAGEAVARVLDDQRFFGAALDEVHQLQRGTVPIEMRIGIGVQKKDDRKVRGSVRIDQHTDVAFEIEIVAAFPTGRRFE